jgi:hypothetical protein
MTRWTRRDLLRAGAAATAAAVPAATLGRSASAATRATAATPADELDANVAAELAGGEPLMVCVHDPAAGRVSILHGTTEVVATDRRLVSAIVRAQRAN